MPEIATIYNVGAGVRDSVGLKLMEGITDIASEIASRSASVEKAMEKINSKQ